MARPGRAPYMATHGTYSVETDPAGGYQVRITGPDGDNKRVMTDFPTRGAARNGSTRKPRS